MRHRALLAFLSVLATPALSATGSRAQAASAVLRAVTPWEIGSLEPLRSGYVFARMQVAETC